MLPVSAVRPRASRRGGAGPQLADEELTAEHPSVLLRGPGAKRSVGAEATTWTTLKMRAAGSSRTGPTENKISSDGRGALTHWMMADMQGRANVPWEVMVRDSRAQVQGQLI